MGATKRKTSAVRPVESESSEDEHEHDDHHHHHHHEHEHIKHVKHTEVDMLATELAGSFALNLAIALCPTSTLAPLGVIACIVLIVTIGGPVSGGHYNPAMTVALHLGGERVFSPVKYMITAIVGAVAAHGFAYVLTGAAPAALDMADSDIGWAKICIAEFLGAYTAAAVVMWAVFWSKDGMLAKASCVGLGFLTSILTFSSVSGAVLNPAVTVALVATGHFTDTHDHASQEVAIFYYLGAQLAGGAFAGITAKALRDREAARGAAAVAHEETQAAPNTPIAHRLGRRQATL